MPESKKGWGVLVGVALFAALLVIGIVPRLRDQSERVAAATAPDAGLVPVSVVTPRRADGPNGLLLPSNIQAIEETAIYARTSGYVRERHVDIGDRVAAGLTQAQANVQQSRASLEQSKANEGFAAATSDRFTRLEQAELIAHQDADEKRTQHVVARATTAAAQANVE